MLTILQRFVTDPSTPPPQTTERPCDVHRSLYLLASWLVQVAWSLCPGCLPLHPLLRWWHGPCSQQKGTCGPLEAEIAGRLCGTACPPGVLTAADAALISEMARRASADSRRIASSSDTWIAAAFILSVALVAVRGMTVLTKVTMAVQRFSTV